MSDIKLNTIEEAIEEIKNGKVIIVVDDDDRENEGDFICAAECITPEIINFMATHGRGLICASLIEDRCEELGLELMIGRNTTTFETPFTVSVDLLGHGCSTGISAHDRFKTIRALVDPETKPEELGRPGHVFPLKAKRGGVLRRAGHTEAAIDFARLSGFKPAGVLVEIMNEDGSMARLNDLVKVAARFKLKLVSIKDLIEYRLKNESLVRREIEVDMPTVRGHFKLIAFEQTNTQEIHMALVKGTWEKDEPVLVRVHSSCMTGDILGSCRCDCGKQLHRAMEIVEQEGKGVVLYMKQDGRGIALLNKLKAYELQERGSEIEANSRFSYDMDERDYGVGAQILRALGITKMRLITNSPKKRVGLTSYGLEIVDIIPIEILRESGNES